MLLTARIGIILLMVSAALYLVSLIPPSNARNSWEGPQTLSPQTFDINYASTPEVLNPLTAIQITAQTNGTLNFKIFSLDYYTVIRTLNTSLPSQNIQILDTFTATYSSYLVRDFNITRGKVFIEYVPPKVENATVMVTNPTSAAVSWSYEDKIVNVIASHDRIFLALTITAPLGVALTVPWLVTSFGERRKTKKTTKTSV
jgi:hypothetical protein